MVSKKEKNYVIVVDSREQKPLWTSGVVRKGLKTGDYSILGFEDKIIIERKSPIDLFGSLGKGHDRFKRELKRAQSLEYFAIVVETNITNIVEKNFEGADRSKMSGETIMKIITTNHMKYGPMIYFVNGRKEAKQLIEFLFEAYINFKIAKYDKFQKVNEVHDGI